MYDLGTFTHLVRSPYKFMILDTGQLPLSGEPLLWFRQGLAFAAAEAYEEAITLFDQVLSLAGDFVEAWYERGLALEAWGYYSEAIASYDQALALKPGATTAMAVWHDRGNALQYGLGDYLGAIACYDQVLSIHLSHPLALQNRGNALMYGLSRPEEALKCYERSLQIDPDYGVGWRNRGNALVELRRYTEAIASYDRALRLDAEDDVAWHARNLAAERLGLTYEPAPTRRAWQTSGFEQDTFVESETGRVVYGDSPDLPSDEFAAILQGHPFLVIEDDQGSREVVLDQDCYVLGRDSRCQICLHSQFVSRQHAVLRRVLLPNGLPGYEITDGNLDGKLSTNGLLINGQKQHCQLLQPSDLVVFGPHVRATFYQVRNLPFR